MKIYQSAAGLCLTALLSACLPGCSVAEMQKINNDLASINSALAGKNTTTARGNMNVPGGALATMPAAESGKKQITQIIPPTDPRIREAMGAAMPNIKKVLEIHQCVREEQGLNQLNFYAVPGVDMKSSQYGGYNVYPNHKAWMMYHDLSKCVSITTLDQWSMPALNALRFRAVYLADDSGETTNFSYLYKKLDDGTWKLFEIKRG